MDNLQKENPDLDWWFNKIKNLIVTFQTKYKTCAALEENAKLYEIYHVYYMKTIFDKVFL